MSLRRSQQLLLEYVCVPYTARNLACAKGDPSEQSSDGVGDVELRSESCPFDPYLQIPLSQLVDFPGHLLGLDAPEVMKHVDLWERVLQQVVTAAGVAHDFSFETSKDVSRLCGPQENTQ